ncbi:hypothetical protein PTTG_04454 [Puccinia triticina 1-1 BBBD Race 1]|uniref:Uncharacterized protein n=2 Tax=Puccinia triticina TaxID=208348 RepID=A0A180G896_PUCT1|nr:uncharacterized protein PtA15_6A126 [Puccinia triticina]OAV88840.1 hypothetical protein PTTG_04454 [Puccinia triticina 1-1 BBBD Race 1]WAQ85498.1 hypothetical protein PtA15_6A126 [Puccinia triticina]WAR55380.1 hypothetical protein PtB15_6B121 [Puccinia triticina]
MRGLLKDLDDRGGGRWSYLIGTESIISGAGAGLVSSVITCPLDVVKTKLQAQGGLFTSHQAVDYYEGLLGSMRIIWREEGFRGLYRGLGPTIIGYLPTWAIYFTIYDAAKAKLADSRPNHQEDAVAHVLAAMTAGATSTIATNPLWLIKTRFMTQRVMRDPQSERYRHTFDAIRRIHAKEGLRGFYRGLVPSLFGVTHVAIQFPLYEQIKLYYKKQPADDLPSSQILMASAASKMLASLLTYPHEVLRTRLQVHALKSASDSTTSSSHPPKPSKLVYPKLREVFRIIVQNEGFAGLYHGMGVNLIRTVPSSALTILTYELMMRHLTALTRHP